MIGGDDDCPSEKLSRFHEKLMITQERLIVCYCQFNIGKNAVWRWCRTLTPIRVYCLPSECV